MAAVNGKIVLADCLSAQKDKTIIVVDKAMAFAPVNRAGGSRPGWCGAV